MNELNDICKKFFISKDENDALTILRYLRHINMNDTIVYIAPFFIQMFPYFIDFKDELALSSYSIGNHNVAFDALQDKLDNKGLSQQQTDIILFNQHFSINHVTDRFTHYNQDKIDDILSRPTKAIPLITLTITTCKRFDLFEQTINSVINCFDIELIDHWFCVDDNSNEEDRQKMKSMYPFFEFYWKDNKEKGHPQSMNIIRNYIKTPYYFHLEDDWKFFTPMKYLYYSLEVLQQNPRYGQCLFNKNYAEIEADIDVKGGLFMTTHSGFRYYIHEFVNNSNDLDKWIVKYGNSKSSNYWPHFSFRPSLLRTSVIKNIGQFDTVKSHFEMDYAYKYINQGYISTFFEGIYSIHIGRLTSQRNDTSKLNAYQLNDEIQFYGKEEKLKSCIKTFVVNLDRRPDRWETFTQLKQLDFLNYKRFSAIDGEKLISTHQLQQIFENNDYNMRKGMVGCFMSHIVLCTQLINSQDDTYLILEDDVEVNDDFEKKFLHLCDLLKHKDWDFCFIGHHIRNTQENEWFDKISLPSIEKYDSYKSFVKSLGGTTAYLISKIGAKKYLDFLDSTGCTNGADTCIQKSADKLNVYYSCPNLIFSDCFRGQDTIDSNIQYDYSSLSKSIEQRLQDELLFFSSINIITQEFPNLNDFINEYNQYSSKDPFVLYIKINKEENIIDIIKSSCAFSYFIEDSFAFVVINGENVIRYYHRFKKLGVYNVEDAIQYSSLL